MIKPAHVNFIERSGITLLVKMPITPVTHVVRMMAMMVFCPRLSVPQRKSSSSVVSFGGRRVIKRQNMHSRLQIFS